MKSLEKTELKLRAQESKLDTLLEVTNAVNNNFDESKLFSLFELILQHQLNIGKVIAFVNNGDDWIRVIAYGVREVERHLRVDHDLLSITRITLIENTPDLNLNKAFDVVIPVFHKSKPLAYLLLGDLDEMELKISPIIKHLRFIQTIANIVTVAIENKRLAKEQLKQERIKKELELASEMQSMLIPTSLPNDQLLQIAAYYKPHQQVGGDYYDFIRLNDEEVVLCIGDISGKGVSAALVMANFQAHLRAIVNYHEHLADMVPLLNQRVFESTMGEKFITLFVAKYNLRTHVLHYVNAAHNPPIFRDEDGISELTVGCTGLGMFEEIPSISEGLITVSPNSMLVCFTDGAVELENEAGDLFESDNLKSVIEENHQLSMSQLNKRIVSALDIHRGTQVYNDDVALFSCRFF
ncbi:MAG: PP2C family protein-serine/threonine phosphatase [Salibacteraceae bacterium]